MRLLGVLTAFFTISTLHAASITVNPFKLELDIQEGYSVEGEVELACRYEKFVFGDSAEFETFFQAPKKLSIKTKKMGSMNKVTISSNEKLFFEYDRAFKFGKECRASFKVSFISDHYALGYGVRPREAVRFQLWKGFYDYEEGDQIYDITKIEKYLHRTTYTFTQKRFPSMIHIRILQDGREAATNPWVEKAYLNPDTGKPYTPKR